MPVLVPQRVAEISLSKDPKADILKTVKNHLPRKIFGNWVLLGTYIRPEKTAGGIIRPGMNIEEDVWQGKVGLVLKWGIKAYVSDQNYTFDEEDKAQVGEWVTYMVGDAKHATINGYPCRLVRDFNILTSIDNPDSFF